jgi:hypothetical protein
MLLVDILALRCIDLLDFFDYVILASFDAAQCKQLVQVEVAFGQRLAFVDEIAFFDDETRILLELHIP